MKNDSWFKDAVVYQIYPRSFADGNGDGVGDLAGITSKLDYFTQLGVDALWLSPIYASPMADFGYDVSNYYAIDPLFGTLDDFTTMATGAHLRGIKVIMDFVPNHTSIEHPWFTESRASRDNPKRDWYIWHPPKADGSAPNNWISNFGGSAWKLDETTGEYYLHSFLAEQPDLNWENPEVREAIYDAMRFWYGLGVDGFRVDAVNFMSKDPAERDNARNMLYQPDVQSPSKALDGKFSMDGPHMGQWLHEMALVAKEFDARCLYFEANPHLQKTDPLQYIRYYEWCDTSMSAPFNFGPIFLPWKADTFKNYINTFERELPEGAMPSYVLGNHDRPRLATRTGVGAARSAAVLQLMLPGTQFIYYGEELGLENVTISPKQIRDPYEKLSPGHGRDAARTPMPWSADANAGFSTATPWLPLNRDYKKRNVAAEQADNKSIWQLYRTLLELRKQTSTLRSGIYEPVDISDEGIYAYLRRDESKTILVIINFTDQQFQLHGLPLEQQTATLLLTSYLDDAITDIDFAEFTLRAHEGCVIELSV